jgi:hypothetical protein
VRTHLAGAQPWVRAAVQALLFALTAPVWDVLVTHESHNWAVSFATAAGFAVVVLLPLEWRSARRGAARDDDITGGLSELQRRAVVRAAASGTPPEDLSLRPTAVLLARRFRDRTLESFRKTIVLMSAILVVIAVVVVVDRALWAEICLPLYVVVLVSELRSPRTRARRVKSLEDATWLSWEAASQPRSGAPLPAKWRR